MAIMIVVSQQYDNDFLLSLHCKTMLKNFFVTLA